VAWEARPLAVWAASAVCLTLPVSCSIDDAVSCRLAAVCSVRTDRSWLPVAISALAVAMLSADWRMPRITRVSEACMVPRACSRWLVSSRLSRVADGCWGNGLRSPEATCCATLSERDTGWVMLRVMSTEQATPTPRHRLPRSHIRWRARSLASRIGVAAWSRALRCISSKVLTRSTYRLALGRKALSSSLSASAPWPSRLSRITSSRAAT